MPDITETLAPTSDQLDAVDLMGQPPRVFTVTKVDVRPNAEQPVSVHLAEFPRVWRPGKSMRRVLAYCWGKESDGWAGKRVELYCDERVMFGSEAVGGTRISRLSHIDGPKAVPLIVKRGKSATFKVEPLPEAPAAPAEPSPDELAAQIAAALTDAATEAEIREWGNRAHARGLLDITPAGSEGTVRELVQSRLAEVTATDGATS